MIKLEDSNIEIEGIKQDIMSEYLTLSEYVLEILIV